MENLKSIIRNIFKIKNIIMTSSIIMISWLLRYLFFYISGNPLPTLFTEPLHLYRLLYLILIKGFSIILHKIYKKF